MGVAEGLQQAGKGGKGYVDFKARLEVKPAGPEVKLGTLEMEVVSVCVVGLGLSSPLFA